ncbi:MAG TPA: hypothetical protein VF820_05800, partial [Patescibacteria group bacterium]
MILYFDSYITDIPLPGRDRNLLKENIRENCNVYKMPERLEIAKYVLSSYTLYPWSNVLIRYELDDRTLYKEFDKYIKTLFPTAKILHKRSDNQKEYRKSLKILESWGDPWIFYSPNNDHPLISSINNISQYLDELIVLARKWQKQYRFVSIMYSHFSEFISLPVFNTPQYLLYGKESKILEENDYAKIYLVSNGDFSSVQITSINLLKHWFNSVNLSGKKVIRAEDTIHDVRVSNQVIIAPKKIICAHFDGYEHLLGKVNEIMSDQIPPLFIPKGFFTNEIKISYGFSKYNQNWININPSSSNYSFRDQKYGTDLKISLNQIPLFWRSHISVLKVNSEINQEVFNKSLIKQRKILENPWLISSKGISISTVRFFLRIMGFIVNIR